MKEVEVICEADQADRLPRALRIGDETLAIRGIGDRWYDKGANYFKVAASDGRVYLLRQSLEDNAWRVVCAWRLDG
jgi:hypothetical protein